METDLSFDLLRNANETRQREWDPTDAITLAYRGNELAGEVGEACNVIKKLERERIGLRGSRVTKEQLAEYETAIPQEWNAAQPDMDSALRLIADARDNIDACIGELRRILT